jgi:hypothetical protein
VKGVVRLSVITQSEKWEADLKGAVPIEKSFATDEGEVSVKIESITQAEGGWTASLRVTRKISRPARHLQGTQTRRGTFSEEAAITTSSRAPSLLDAGGQTLRSYSSGGTSGGPDANGIQTSTVRMSISPARGGPNGRGGAPRPMPTSQTKANP